MAESEGFEPSKGALPPYSLSRRAPSTDSASSPRTRLAECVRRARMVIVPASAPIVKRQATRSRSARTGGGGGIRTLEALAGHSRFSRPARFNHSATPPRRTAKHEVYRAGRIRATRAHGRRRPRILGKAWSDEIYMAMALEQARHAGEIGEVPIGAVVVCDGAVVSRGMNRREIDHDPAGHAEFLAIREAARSSERWRLSDCTVYVTLEPCPMCAGAHAPGAHRALRLRRRRPQGRRARHAVRPLERRAAQPPLRRHLGNTRRGVRGAAARLLPHAQRGAIVNRLPPEPTGTSAMVLRAARARPGAPLVLALAERSAKSYTIGPVDIEAQVEPDGSMRSPSAHGRLQRRLQLGRVEPQHPERPRRSRCSRSKRSDGRRRPHVPDGSNGAATDRPAPTPSSDSPAMTSVRARLPQVRPAADVPHQLPREGRGQALLGHRRALLAVHRRRDGRSRGPRAHRHPPPARSRKSRSRRGRTGRSPATSPSARRHRDARRARAAGEHLRRGPRALSRAALSAAHGHQPAAARSRSWPRRRSWPTRPTPSAQGAPVALDRRQRRLARSAAALGFAIWAFLRTGASTSPQFPGGYLREDPRPDLPPGGHRFALALRHRPGRRHRGHAHGPRRQGRHRDACPTIEHDGGLFGGKDDDASSSRSTPKAAGQSRPDSTHARDLLFTEIGAGGAVTLEEIKSYAKDNPKTFTEEIKAWNDDATAEADARDVRAGGWSWRIGMFVLAVRRRGDRRVLLGDVGRDGGGPVLLRGSGGHRDRGAWACSCCAAAGRATSCSPSTRRSATTCATSGGSTRCRRSRSCCGTASSCSRSSSGSPTEVIEQLRVEMPAVVADPGFQTTYWWVYSSGRLVVAGLRAAGRLRERLADRRRVQMSSSSGGGGGFSGGGGGGGGGGGSAARWRLAAACLGAGSLRCPVTAVTMRHRVAARHRPVCR